MNLGDIFIFALPIFLNIFGTHFFITTFWLFLTPKKHQTLTLLSTLLLSTTSTHTPKSQMWDQAANPTSFAAQLTLKPQEWDLWTRVLILEVFISLVGAGVLQLYANIHLSKQQLQWCLVCNPEKIFLPLPCKYRSVPFFSTQPMN